MGLNRIARVKLESYVRTPLTPLPQLPTKEDEWDVDLYRLHLIQNMARELLEIGRPSFPDVWDQLASAQKAAARRPLTSRGSSVTLRQDGDGKCSVTVATPGCGSLHVVNKNTPMEALIEAVQFLEKEMGVIMISPKCL